MRLLIVGVCLVAALAGCDRRGGRRVVLMPDEIAGRRDDQWRITQEPPGGGAKPDAAPTQTAPPDAKP
jgi:hypothetical protein